MRKKITVGLKKTKQQGWTLDWRDRLGRQRRRVYKGKRTQSAVRDAITELEEQLNRPGGTRRWSDFENRVEKSFLPGMTDRGQGKPKTMMKRFRAVLAEWGEPDIDCADITEEIVLAVKDRMESEGLAKMTVRSNMAALWSILNWGAENNLLPRLHRPRERVRKGDRIAKSNSKGRALTLEEIERMVQAIIDNPVIRPNAPTSLRTVRRTDESAEPAIRAVHVARLTGMRLEDCHNFRWDPEPGFHYPHNLGGRSPMLAFSSEQKSGSEERIPLTPFAVEYLRSIECETGFVCRMFGARGEHDTAGRLGRVIANAGRAAGIVVKPTGGKMGSPKWASAHDLRRTFGAWLLDHVNIRDAQTMMRHASFETLMRYYSDSTEDALAVKLRSLFAESGELTCRGERLRTGGSL